MTTNTDIHLKQLHAAIIEAVKRSTLSGYHQALVDYDWATSEGIAADAKSEAKTAVQEMLLAFDGLAAALKDQP